MFDDFLVVLKGGWSGGCWGWPNGETKKREMER